METRERGLRCERVGRNRYRLSADHHAGNMPATIYRRGELSEMARQWANGNADRETLPASMFSMGTLRQFGEKLTIMISEKADRWDSRLDA